MKKFIYVFALFILGSSAIFAQTAAPSKTVSKTVEIVEREKFDPTKNPNDDLQTAIAAATKQNKRIVLDVGGEWCGWCIHMDKFLAARADLKKLRDENFVWVKINMSEENENKEFLSKYPEIKGYPHLFVLEKDGSLLKSKDTSELEDGKTYNPQKFMDFLKEYAPVKTTAAK
ncbi:MAG: thioredoxin family protein [Pyrinomonadaceae bacterium]